MSANKPARLVLADDSARADLLKRPAVLFFRPFVLVGGLDRNMTGLLRFEFK